MTGARPIPSTVREVVTEIATCSRCDGRITRTPPAGAWWHLSTLLTDCPKVPNR